MNQNPKSLIENTYSWDGSKRRRVLDQIGQQLSDERYFGDLVTENGLPSLILHADGYVDVSGMQPVFIYHLKDHLGNVRIVMQAGGSSGTLKQSNDYYPFGMAFTRNSSFSEDESFARENKYKYNGKEEQPMPGKWLDYGARFYDAQLGRWHSIDPLAEAFISFTPYHYVRNNPVKLYDINGMADKEMHDMLREIDANYNAQHDAMFNSIVTGPALGRTQTVKNTDEKKKKNEGDGEDPAGGGGNGFGIANDIIGGAGVVNGLVGFDAAINSKHAYRYAQRINGRVVSAAELTATNQAKALKVLNVSKSIGNKLGVAGGLVIAGDVLYNSEVKASHGINAVMTGIAFTGWGAPVAGIWFVADFGTGLITGKSISDRIDSGVGAPLVDWDW